MAKRKAPSLSFDQLVDGYNRSINNVPRGGKLAAFRKDFAGNCTAFNQDNTCKYLYDDWVSYLDADGTPLQSDTKISASSSNPHNQTYAGFIGDYQDIWDDTHPSGERAAAARIGDGRVDPASPAVVNGDGFVTSVSY